MSKKCDINLKHFLINKLRRISYMYPARKEAIKKARVSRGKYKCSSCDKVFSRNEIQLDHVIPVIDPHKGFTNWDDFINRLFCDVDGWSIKCKSCHKYKTFMENEIRKQADIRQDLENDDF